MAAVKPRDLLSEGLLDRLGVTGEGAAGEPADARRRTGARDAAGDTVARDIAILAEAGYLNVALPPEFGGLGCTLRQAACGQRRLARHAPDTAFAVSAHLYWTGAAADAYRAGDDSGRWILAEAARGALFAGGHGEVGGDLRFADPRSRCEPGADGGYRFPDASVLSTVTPSWDWLAVHAVHAAGRGRPPRSVIAFAGRGGRCTPAFRVARVQPAGAPGDVFTTSALTWGHSILASVQYSDARRAFNEALTAYADAAAAALLADSAASHRPAPSRGQSPTGQSAVRRAGDGHPGGRWPVAEAGARLDAMKARIAEVTHPWQLVQTPAPDLGGQHLIGLHAMRHEVAEGADSVHDLVARLTGTRRHRSHPVA